MSGRLGQPPQKQARKRRPGWFRLDTRSSVADRWTMQEKTRRPIR